MTSKYTSSSSSEVATDVFEIKSFQSGIRQDLAEGLMQSYQALELNNCNVSYGSLKSVKIPELVKTYTDDIKMILPYYDFNTQTLFYKTDNYIMDADGMYKSTNELGLLNSEFIDYTNFQYKDKRVLVFCGGEDDYLYMFDGTNFSRLKNRRIKYNSNGYYAGCVDGNGEEMPEEAYVKTYAPSGKFIEIYKDRLWVAGNVDNPDRIYFSTSNVNGSDIEDWTIPLADEEEINQHGGFIDVRSYDGGNIIGLKQLFGSLVIFKNKSAYKIYGDTPEDFELVQLFNCGGAIADKTICSGSNGAFFLNTDGIYFYDGTNIKLISDAVKDVVNRINKDYISNSVGAYFNNKYYLSVPLDDSKTNNMIIVYDISLGSFTLYEVDNVSCLLELNNELYYTSNKSIYKFNESSNNKSLPLKWVTPIFDFDLKNARKMSTYIYFRAKGNGKVKFTLKTERKVKELIADLSEEEKFYRKKFKNKGRMFQLIFENVDGSDVEIIYPQLYVEVDED